MTDKYACPICGPDGECEHTRAEAERRIHIAKGSHIQKMYALFLAKGVPTFPAHERLSDETRRMISSEDLHAVPLTLEEVDKTLARIAKAKQQETAAQRQAIEHHVIRESEYFTHQQTWLDACIEARNYGDPRHRQYWDQQIDLLLSLRAKYDA